MNTEHAKEVRRYKVRIVASPLAKRNGYCGTVIELEDGSRFLRFPHYQGEIMIPVSGSDTNWAWEDV